MLKFFCRLMFRLHGWTVDKESFADAQRCVIVAAPHTSNWDAVYALAAMDIIGLPLKFTIKKEFDKPVIGKWLADAGAVWIDRQASGGLRKRSMIEVMVDYFKTHDKIALIITPEGSRSKRTEWKTGFYHIARQANVPIALGYVDYERKVGGIGKVIHDTSDLDAVMREMMEFYKDIPGKFPEKFSIDLRYA